MFNTIKISKYDRFIALKKWSITSCKIESKDPQQIISGNEKVVRPRLADAEFFFNTDRKKRAWWKQKSERIAEHRFGTFRTST